MVRNSRCHVLILKSAPMTGVISSFNYNYNMCLKKKTMQYLDSHIPYNIPIQHLLVILKNIKGRELIPCNSSIQLVVLILKNIQGRELLPCNSSIQLAVLILKNIQGRELLPCNSSIQLTEVILKNIQGGCY